MNNKIDIDMRWMIRRDMPEVLNIESLSFEFPWSQEDFIRTLRQRNSIGMVIQYKDSVVGFLIYELHKNRIHILNFAVKPEYRKMGFGTFMIQKMKDKLSQKRRNRILLEVRESNLTAQLFFRANGFRAISVLKDYYEEVQEDAYLMQYGIAGQENASQPNRTQYVG